MRHGIYRYVRAFQFHKGTIKTLILYFPKVLCANFNSIKVRLKQTAYDSFEGGFLFQFHKGTIKTTENATVNTSVSKFQFHKGTIKT